MHGDSALHVRQGCISGLVYGLGDVTAQAFDSRTGYSDLDWQRTLRSAAIGAFAHGPLSHLVFSSDNSLIDHAAQLSVSLQPSMLLLLPFQADRTIACGAMKCHVTFCTALDDPLG